MSGNNIPVSSSTTLGALAIELMNGGRKAGQGMRFMRGTPVLLGVDPEGGELYVCDTATGARVGWLCWNKTAAEVLAYLRHPRAPEPTAWRAAMVEHLEQWGSSNARS